MTMLTRSQSTSVFEFIRREFLEAEADSPIYRALEYNGILNIIDLLSFPIEEVNGFKYLPVPVPQEAPEPAQHLHLGHKNLIKIFMRWCKVLITENQGKLLTEDEWMALEPDDFGLFRLEGLMVSSPAAHTMATPPRPTLAGTPGNTAPPRAAPSKVADFKKSIKRDASSYPALKDQKNWNSWNRAVIAQARAHDVSEVFDIDYAPPDDDKEAIELFQQKQSFVYAVLNTCVLTDTGKEYVREHESDFDAQAVYYKLVSYARKSTAAQLTIDRLVEYLTTARLNSGWKGSSVGFLLHWHEQFRLLEELLPYSQHYSSEVKKRMLEAAVKQIPELQQIKNTDNNRVAAGGTPMDYDCYRSVLMSAAELRDDHLKLPATRSKNIVQNANSTWHDESTAEPSYFDGGYLDSGDQYVGNHALEYDQQLSVYNQSQLRRNGNGPNRGGRTRLPREI